MSIWALYNPKLPKWPLVGLLDLAGDPEAGYPPIHPGQCRFLFFDGPCFNVLTRAMVLHWNIQLSVVCSLLIQLPELNVVWTIKGSLCNFANLELDEGGS